MATDKPFNPTGAKPGDGKPAPPNAIIVVRADALEYAPAPQPPQSLHDRLMAVVKEARAAGYAVVVMYPEELIGVDNEALQIHLVREGKAYASAHLEPEDEE